MSLVSTLAQTTISTPSAGSFMALSALWVLSIVLLVFTIVGLWKLFEKADEAGWKSIIPFYSAYTLFRIAGRNGWGFLLMLVPIVNIVVYIMVALDLAKHFGKSTTFAVFGLMLFPYIGYFMIGLGDDKYVGVKHA